MPVKESATKAKMQAVAIKAEKHRISPDMERNQTNVCIFGQVCPGEIYRLSTEAEKQTETEE